MKECDILEGGVKTYCYPSYIFSGVKIDPYPSGSTPLAGQTKTEVVVVCSSSSGGDGGSGDEGRPSSEAGDLAAALSVSAHDRLPAGSAVNVSTCVCCRRNRRVRSLDLTCPLTPANSHAHTQ